MLDIIEVEFQKHGILPLPKYSEKPDEYVKSEESMITDANENPFTEKIINYGRLDGTMSQVRTY